MAYIVEPEDAFRRFMDDLADKPVTVTFSKSAEGLIVTPDDEADGVFVGAMMIEIGLGVSTWFEIREVGFVEALAGE